MNPDPPIAGPSADPEFAASVRAALDAARFTEEGVLERLDCGESLVVEARELPHLLALTAEGRPLDTLLRLFLFGTPVTERAARDALAPAGLDACLDGGLLLRTPAGVEAPLRIVPQLGLRIAFDPPTHTAGREARPDHVPGLGRSSSYLVNATVRRPVQRALDLGTGCGGQGLALARHARQVIATDVNPRALAISAFNAQLNGISNLELRAGSLFTPVEGERFDLITMNPPFAIAPDARFVFRDGGMDADGFVERVVREAPGHLAPGGLLQITAQWAHVEGEDWRERLRRWCEGPDCDAWVIRLYTQSAETYAANWISETERHDPPAFAARWGEWMEAFRRRRIDAVSTGLIQLRRARSPGQGDAFWTSEEVSELDADAGEAVARGFEAQDFLRHADDTRLLATPFRVSPDVRLEQRASSEGAGWSGEGASLSLERGLRQRIATDPRVAQLVGRCDGRRPLSELVAELGAAIGAGPEAMQRSLLPIVRGLVERGFLRPPIAGAVPAREAAD